MFDPGNNLIMVLSRIKFLITPVLCVALCAKKSDLAGGGGGGGGWCTRWFFMKGVRLSPFFLSWIYCFRTSRSRYNASTVKYLLGFFPLHFDVK